jgi:predicted permease
MTPRDLFSARLVAAARALARRPVYAGLSVLLLALGVAAVTAIFAVINAALLRPLPYAAPRALFAVWGTEPVTHDSVASSPLAAMQLVRLRRDNRSFEKLEGYTPATFKLLGDGNPESVPGYYVSAGMFDLFGIAPARGRSFALAEEVRLAPVAIISHGLWMRRFAADPSIVGRTVNIDDQPRVVVGIMPPSFTFLYQKADVFLPMPLGAEDVATVRTRQIAALGRIKPGVSPSQARADIAALNAQLGRELPEQFRFTGARVTPLQEDLFGSQRAGLMMLFAAVSLLFGVSIVNVLSLTLADVLARRTSTMTRLALGANRRSVMASRIAESVIIAACGGLLGMLTGRLILVALRAALPDAFARAGDLSIDALVIGLAVGISIIAGVFSGLYPAIQESRVDIAGLTGSSTKSVGGTADRRSRDTLLATQVGLAVVLLSGAALLGRNVRTLLARPTGMRPAAVAVVEMTLSQTRYSTKESRAEYVRRLLEALRALPEVASAASIQTRFVLNETMQSAFDVDGRPPAPGVQQFANIRHTTPGVVEALGMRILKGRPIDADDRMDSPPVALVSASFAKQYLAGKDPIGQRIKRMSQGAPWMEVVGVVDDTKDGGLGVDLGPTFYVSYFQQNTPTARVSLVVRSRAGDPRALFAPIRRTITGVDPNQPIDALDALDDLLLRSAAQPRFQALVSGLFGAASLLLVLAGIYAVTLYALLRRTRELGVRAALGATPRNLVALSMWSSMRPVTAGLVVGGLCALPALRAAQTVLHEGLSAVDVWLFAIVIAAIVLAAAFAAFVPARRATRISPAMAMRDVT